MNQQFSNKGKYTACKFIVAVIALSYLLWEIYWARKVGYLFIKWHTHLAFYFYLWAACYSLIYLINKVWALKSHVKIQTITISIFLALAIAEMLLYTLGIGDTYMEKIKFGYASRYDARFESYYRVHTPNEVFNITRPEFTYERRCNSLGFSDIEWQKRTNPRQKRFLCLGDSFTEGVGAPYDSCYVSLLHNLLNKEDSTIYVMNGGISGDDPCINYIDYKEFLEPYQPDYILQTLSSNDMNTDIATKGGLERFQKDKTIKFRPAPWWEPIYAFSYISRLFFNAAGYNEMLIKIPFTETEKSVLDKCAIALFNNYAKEAKKNGSALIVILQPNQREIYDGQYEYDLSNIVTNIKSNDNIKVYDLIPYYLKVFKNNKDGVRNYYWPQDGHHNAKGYQIMAAGIKNCIDSLTLK